MIQNKCNDNILTLKSSIGNDSYTYFYVIIINEKIGELLTNSESIVIYNTFNKMITISFNKSMKCNPINLIGNLMIIIIDCNCYKSYKISIICFADE